MEPLQEPVYRYWLGELPDHLLVYDQFMSLFDPNYPRRYMQNFTTNNFLRHSSLGMNEEEYRERLPFILLGNVTALVAALNRTAGGKVRYWPMWSI